MGQEQRIKVWGVRGSMPTADRDHLRYGGHTACISADLGGDLVVLDAGSGLVPLGERLVQEGRRRADILIGHLHLDHIMGLFAFPLLQDRRAEVHLYGSPGTMGALVHLIGPPLWPVGLADRPAKVELHACRTGEPFRLAGLPEGPAVTVLEGCHPGGCGYYRLEQGGRSLVYALDCELSGDMAERLTEFARGTDLLIWDASFAPGSLREGWGHATWEQGIALGQAAGAGRILMSHYGTDHDDAFLEEQEALACQASPLVRFAKEGMEMVL